MCNGKQHDFNLFKESGVQILSAIKVFADSGYQGINKLRKNTEIPKKETKKTFLASHRTSVIIVIFPSQGLK